MSILDPSYMIDLGGIDVIQSQGVAIPGLYQKLLDNIGPCGNPLIYNWKFNGVFIPPQFVEPILEDDAIYINDIYVSSDDVVHIPSIEIQPNIVQLNVSENGEYVAPVGVDGYNPVSVDVQPNIVQLNVSENGEYEAPEGVDGYSPVVVDVQGLEYPTHSISVISSLNIFTEFECDKDQLPQNLKKYPNAGGQFFETSAGSILYAEMAAVNTSATIYAVIKSLTSYGDFAGVSFAHVATTQNFPLIYTRSDVWQCGTYANDFSTGISSNVFRVLALAVDNSTKIARFFIDDAKMSTEKQYINSGKCAGWGGGITNAGTIALASAFDVRYGALVQGVETDAEILANMALISAEYSSILGT